jgi:hypothetical protein
MKFMSERHQIGFPGLGDRRHGKAAGEMDRRPQPRHAVEQFGDRGFVGEVRALHQLDLRVAAQGKGLRLGRDHKRDMTDGAGLDQRVHHCRAERAGPAGDDDMTVAIVHRMSPKDAAHHRRCCA